MRSTLHGLGELIAYLPYELGFRPTDSLVVVGLADQRIRVVARLDLGEEDDLLPGIGRIGQVFARAGVRARCAAPSWTPLPCRRMRRPDCSTWPTTCSGPTTSTRRTCW
ncbi:DUF4192 family protein [Allobranchiibius sp. GilTou73]|uniref:DUF4192 family protein n=1 Tax=Allobranchiibius sp. GilTou73 TaxID=2904523 RepID=UPI001F284800|nr:DUF4192 family protein [Allobranchiibius sp. GilTou73]UIJ33525.1 DUF4192 domain-containing protein [Allobranchiibius sp. GilTou73]